MSESTQDVSPLDVRLAGIDHRLREIQAELVPERTPRDTPEAPPRSEPLPRGRAGPLASLLARGSRAAPARDEGPASAEAAVTAEAPPAAPAPSAAEAQLERLGELTALYGELLASLRDVVRGQAAPQTATRATPPAEPEPPTPPPPAEPMQPAPSPPLAGPEPSAPAGELVTLSAGPFSTIGAVRAFERELTAVPGVRDVLLRGYEGDDHAVFDVRVGESA
jgi:hypothetical protein